MKPNSLVAFWLLFLAAAFPLFAQTSVFPTDGSNVGIGTTSPATLLQVLGPITAGNGAGSTQGIDYIYGFYNGSGKLFTLGSLYSSAASFLGYSVKAHSGAVGYVSSNGLTVGRSAFEANNGFLAFLTGASQSSSDGGSVTVTERMRIDVDGNVGVGTSTPTDRLHIFGSGNSTALTIETGHVNNTWLRLKNDSSGGRAWLLNSSGSSWPGGGGSFFIWDETAGFERLRIDTSGNVGIGTTSPTQKLSVNGTIRAKEVIVDTGWSDYVFRSDYRLAPLSEVEREIQKDGHLPGLPSASEVAEHGIGVGEMQSKLLAKIEELTLHQIAQEKRTAAQERRTALLENENDALHRELTSLKQSLSIP